MTSPVLTDQFNRRIDYVRLSVTDRCDLRSRYCIPEGFKGFEEPEHWLSFDEIERLIGAFARLSVSRIRMTGGEPLLRRDIVGLSRRIAALPGVDDLSLSTNATQLDKHAQALKDAGAYMCLGHDEKFEFRPMLRNGCSDAELEAAIIEAINLKPERHEFNEAPHKILRFMSMTGG